MANESQPRSQQIQVAVRRDPERRALAALATRLKALPKKRTPIESLQVVTDLSKKLTRARYTALSETDEHDRVEGFVTSGLDPSQLAALSTPPQGHGPLGSLRQDGKPVYLDDLDKHAKAFGFPGNHPEMTSLLGVAIWVRGGVRGALYATDRHGKRDFNHVDEIILTTLAAHAGRVIEAEWY